jgi:hypothetical protein
MTVVSHWLSLSNRIAQNPLFRSRMETKVSPSTVHIISWIKGNRNGYWQRNLLNMQKSMTNQICLFFLGMAKPCVAHLDLFVLQRTQISHSLLTSFFNRSRGKCGTWYGLSWYGLALGLVSLRWTGLQGNFPSFPENRMECFFHMCQRACYYAWLRWVGIMSSKLFAW